MSRILRQTTIDDFDPKYFDHNYQFADETTITKDVSDNTEAVTDKGSEGNNLVQTDPAKRIPYVSDAINGFPGLNNDGSEKKLVTTTPITIQQATIFAVIKSNINLPAGGDPNLRYGIVSADDAAVFRSHISFWFNSIPVVLNNIIFMEDNDSPSNICTGDTEIANFTNGFVLAVLYNKSGTTKIYADNVLVGSCTNLIDDLIINYIGQGYGTARGMDARMTQLAIKQSILSESEIFNISQSLQAQYGLG